MVEKRREAFRKEKKTNWYLANLEVAQASLRDLLLPEPYSPSAWCAIAGGRLSNQYDNWRPFDTVSARA